MSAEIIDPQVNYLKSEQIADLKGDQQEIVRNLRSSDPRQQLQDKDEAARTVKNAQRQLDRQTPPDLSPQQLDALVKEERAVREKLLEGMPSQREMRANPPGVVARHRTHQKRTKTDYKGAPMISWWKNARRAMGANHVLDYEDPDLANLERYRPTKDYGNLDNAQVMTRDYDFPSPQFSENYDQVDWHREEAPAEPEPEGLEVAPAPEAEEVPSLNCSYCGQTCKNKTGLALHERRWCKKKVPA